MAWIYYSNDINKIEILKFLWANNFALLWIKPKDSSFKKQELNALLKALGEFNCILWFISCENNFLSPKMNDIKRTFSKWKNLSKNVFAKKEYFLEQTKYSDLSLLTFLDITEGEQFFSRGLFGLDSTVAFVKALDIDFFEFDSLVNIWFKHLKEKPIVSSQDKKSKIINYLNKMTQKQGVAGLIVEDTETCKSLILLSKNEYSLKQAFIKLQISEHFNVINDNNLSNFMKRGIGLKLLS
jgi:hypothetical protein